MVIYSVINILEILCIPRLQCSSPTQSIAGVCCFMGMRWSGGAVDSEIIVLLLLGIAGGGWSEYNSPREKGG